MQSEHMKLAELLTQSKHVSPEIFERQAIQDYLNHITASTLEDLAREPEELKQEKARLEKQWSEITCTEYKAFIEANEHFEQVAKQFKILPGSLDKVETHIPTVERLLNDTEKCHLENIATRRNLHLISSQLDNLEPILEIPTLFDTLIRNGHYEEAMDLQLFTQRLPIRYPNVPFFEDLASSKNSSQTMLLQLLSMLRGPVKLPLCIRVIGYLKRLGIKDKTLRILFLTLRQDHLNSLLALVKENQPNDYVRRWIETQREYLFDLVTHYKAIFPNTTDSLQECPILCSFASYAISKLVKVLQDFLDKVQDISLLPSINTQVMYYGMSLGRVGLDFRPIVVAMFEQTTKRVVLEMVQEIKKSFHINEVMIERPKKDMDIQDFLMKSHTVALTYNKYMTILNQVRYFPCKTLHPELSAAFIESLAAISNKIMEHHSKSPRDSEIVAWIFVDGLLPGVVSGLDKVLDGPTTDYSSISKFLNDLKETAIAHGVKKVSEVQVEQLDIEEPDENPGKVFEEEVDLTGTDVNGTRDMNGSRSLTNGDEVEITDE
ncbi:conserved oligomeric Golgi complex component [Terramyces sp. JEL0728]|nr:conserved oligomeric Golgi complex component [Terramyces sp. JEL0728]